MIGGCERNMRRGPDGDVVFRFSASTVRRCCAFRVRVGSCGDEGLIRVRKYVGRGTVFASQYRVFKCMRQ